MRKIRIVAIVALFILVIPLLSCNSDTVEPDNFSLAGAWTQYSESSKGAHRATVFFGGSGSGEIWSVATDGIGLTEVHNFEYRIVEFEKVILSYDSGSSDTLHLSYFHKDEVTITVEGRSDWFDNGVLTRAND